MKRIMGIDYGDARTGVAISDLLCSIVGTTYVVPSRVREKAVADIVRLARDNDVGTIVVGLPKNMDGTEGSRAALCREFAEVLREATGLKIAMWDERRTTVEAHNILSEHNYHGKKRKNTVDAVAASLILEGYLAYLRRLNNSRAPAISSRTPKGFLRISVSRLAASQLPRIAAAQPEIMPGRLVFQFSVPCFLCIQQLIRAEGRKKSRLICRASAWDTPSTRVSQSISRLPPPIPSPVRNPSTVPTTKQIGREFSINTASLPRQSESPAHGEATGLGFLFPKSRRPARPTRCRADRAGQRQHQFPR